jgi:hypothetical protein
MAARQPKAPTPDSSERTAIFKWTAAQEQALWLVFDGKLSLNEVALNVAVSSRTLDRWVAHPAFKSRLAQMKADLEASLASTVYVSKQSRLMGLSQMALAARKEFERRPWLKEVRPGPKGDVTNEKFNAEAHAAYRAALADIAAEKGERKNVTELTGKDGGPIEVSDAHAKLATRLAALAERQRPAGTPGQPDGSGI